MYKQISFPWSGMRFPRGAQIARSIAPIAAIITIVTGLVTGVQLYRKWSADKELFDALRGIDSPTLRSLELTNEKTQSHIKIFLENEESANKEDRALAEAALRKAIRNEQHTACPRTAGYLLALHGKYFLNGGNFTAAIVRLNEANRRFPRDPYILELLIQSYDQASLKLQKTASPWPIEVQKKIRQFGSKAEELRRELRLLQALYFGLDPGEVLAFSPGLTRCMNANDPACTSKFDVGREFYVDFSGSVDKIAHNFADADVSRRVLAVGVNAYDPATGFRPLAYAVHDASRVLTVLAQSDYTGALVVDGRATRENILGALTREALASRPGDDFVFYFAGHGFTDKHGRSAVVAMGDNGDGIGFVTLEEIERTLSFHNGTVTVIVDACLNKLDVDFGSLQEGLHGRNSPAFFVAGAPGSVAIESRQLGAGIFTDVMLRSISQAARSRTAGSVPPRIDFDHLWANIATDTKALARKLYGIDQQPKSFELTHGGN